MQIAPFDERALAAHLEALGAGIEPPIASRYGAQGTGSSRHARDPCGNRVERTETLPAA